MFSSPRALPPVMEIPSSRRVAIVKEDGFVPLGKSGRTKLFMFRTAMCRLAFVMLILMNIELIINMIPK